MKKEIKILLIVLAVLTGGIFIYHIIHHQLYCQYRTVKGKSHCKDCGHRPICQKYHHRNV